MNAPSLLDGVTALITGASRGIGAAVAIALADAGASVGLISRDEAALRALAENVSGSKAVAFGAVDVSNSQSLARCVNELAKELGAPTVLVNNVGTIERLPIQDMTPEGWQRVLATNLGAAVTASTAVLPYMRAQGRGSIVNITSLSAHFGVRRAASYGASKSALLGLTRALALEWAPDSIRVNAVTPGYIATDFTRPLSDDPQRSQRVLQRIPLGRWGRPDDVAGTVVYLSSSMAEYVTGQVVVVDGGYSVDG